MMEVTVFIICSVIVLSGALGVLIARNPVHAALFLVETLFGIAVLFIMLDATFLAAVQVVVYAGAIVILFLFVIMLLGVDKAEDLGIEPISGQRPLTIIIGTSILGLVLTTLLISVNGPTGTLAPTPEPTTNTKNLGEMLFTDHLFAVELTALLLTVAVVGAVSLARRIKGPLQPLPIVEAVSDEEIEVQETKDVE
ncbi:MAG: NADH-quinone oxidoreductase subunit J [Acidimicrobiaceae bacterium]|jgi:NADH-quinone oxidoreductase subunit J|nr:NADH-quinone oxidoreductase subunit J [Acidimicrobiaceae bacterium]|tara:strand:+ start:6252 stop:6839 length:588 start_codon:yes stop_codon:yes gene_type:complete